MDTKHTALPWLHAPTGKNMNAGYSQPFGISAADKPNLVAGLFGDVDGGPEVAAANAAFIVTACNSYYDMLGALRTIASHIEATGEGVGFRLIVNAAIAKAEGK